MLTKSKVLFGKGRPVVRLANLKSTLGGRILLGKVSQMSIPIKLLEGYSVAMSNTQVPEAHPTTEEKKKSLTG
jgi:hypothetical protein